MRIFNKNQISFDISWFKLILLICYSCKLILKWVSLNKTQMARKHLLMVIKHLTLKQSKKETQNNFPTATTTSLSPRICRAGRAWSWLVLISKENLISLLWMLLNIQAAFIFRPLFAKQFAVHQDRVRKVTICLSS